MSTVVYGTKWLGTADPNEVFWTTLKSAEDDARDRSMGNLRTEVIRYVAHAHLSTVDRAVAMLNRKGWYIMATIVRVFENGVRLP